MEDLRAGDVVELKSGGPKMTIADIDDYGLPGSAHRQARCVWFDRAKKSEEIFELHELRKVPA